MHDFTKEELIYLLKCADPKYGIHFESVCEKIEYMIDNYCDNDDFPGINLYPPICCKKCNQQVFGGYSCPCRFKED